MQLEIENNSPSKCSTVDRSFINKLKQKRLEERSKSREGVKIATLQDSTNILNIIRQNMKH
jgi:hypothetical protein